MICPRDNMECAKPQVCIAGKLCHKPSLAEIERLADESEACAALCWGLRRNSKRLDDAGKDYRAARAALMAAVKLYGEG